MNHYLKSQINNMITMAEAFQRACHLAATEDNGKIDKIEEKLLKRTDAAAEHMIKDLEKALKKYNEDLKRAGE